MRWLAYMAVAAAIASANPTPASAQKSEHPADAPRVSPTADDDPAWSAYDRAFVLLAKGDVSEANAALQTLVGSYPGHPAAVRASARLREIRVGDVERRPTVSGESRTNLARAELTLTMTWNGVSLALNACQLFECDGDRERAAALMTGGAAGLALSLYFTRGGVTAGQAQLVGSSMSWGTWNSLALNDGFADDGAEGGVAVAAQLGGLGLGLGLIRVWKPTSGDVALTNTGGVWTTILAALGYGIADEEPSLRALVIAGDIGLLVGAAISRSVKMSRGRTLLIDAGGVIGFLGGGLVVVAAEPDSDSGAFTPLFIGTAAGLAAAAALTRDWDLPKLPDNLAVGITPMGERGYGLAVSWQ